MPTGVRAFASNTNTSAGSAFSTAVALPTSGPGGTVAVGDLVIISAVSERAEFPTITYGGTTTGVTVVRSTGNANVSSVIAWKRITSASELGASVQMANTVGRRQTLGVLVVSGAADPLFTSTGLTTNAAGNVTATMPAVTPTAADAMLVAALNYAPYQGTLFSRSATVAAPYTERVDAMGAYTGGANPGVVFATEQLTGGNGVSQSGAVFTTTEGTFMWVGDTITLLPALVTTAPSATITDKGALYVFEASGVAVGGGALSYSIAQISGTATTPVALGAQRWGVEQDVLPLVYEVTVTEASNPLPGKQRITIPGVSNKGLSRRRKLTASGWA